LRYQIVQQVTWGVVIALCVFIFSCSRSEETINVYLSNGPYPTILISQAQFTYDNKSEKKLPKPGPAVLILKQKTAQGWTDTVLEDPKSNVFHKSMVFGDKILTIGAMEAALKLWEFRANTWQQTLLWNPVFGGKWDRLRDVEAGDVTGDGKPEIVVATHDQGVVAVAMQKGQSWDIKEIDRKPGVFVHEVEIGDIDGNGRNEFFVTPSHPNKIKGGPQPGEVVMYSWDGTNFYKKIIDSFEKTHAKEILVCDMNGKGTSTLFSVVEAETKSNGNKTIRVEPVKIKKYTFNQEMITSEVIATLDDFQCRFLTAGDVDGDGRLELVASAMKSGIWMIKRHDESWKVSLVDSDSSGYEHATYIDDLDKDGLEEIYVASDDQQEFRRYVWNGKAFTKSIISHIPENRITWNITTGRF
jgi:hypothetical protein